MQFSVMMKNIGFNSPGKCRKSLWVSSALLAAMMAGPVAAEEGAWQELPPPSMERAPDGFEPEVVISPSKESDIREYRANGALYMIEVTSDDGLTYYLVDTDGDGSMETRSDAAEPNIMIPRWVLKRWK